MSSEAEQQVAAFHHHLEKEYGISPEQMRKMVNIMFRLMEKEERFERYGEWAVKATIFSIVGGVGVGVVFVMKAVWASLHGGH